MPSNFNKLTSSQNLKTTRRMLFLVSLSSVVRLSSFFSQLRGGEKFRLHNVNVSVGFASSVDLTENWIFTILLFTLFFESGGAVRKINK